MHDPRLHSAAAERNAAPILAELLRRLPPHGHALEIAAGSGQHAARFAAALPGWQWQPSDGDPACRASIAAWCAGLPNVLPPRVLDVTAGHWPGIPAGLDLVYAANLLHISPWPATAGLLRGAARHLAAGGRLLLYGPFQVPGEPLAPSNAAFDADLRQRNPLWGLRSLDALQAEARQAGLALRERVPMPANNLLLVLGRSAAGAGA
jgi:SAM-dependent methyltransferase